MSKRTSEQTAQTEKAPASRLREIEQHANRMAEIKGEEDGIYRLVGDVARTAADEMERNARAISQLVDVFMIAGYSEETRRVARRVLDILRVQP